MEFSDQVENTLALAEEIRQLVRDNTKAGSAKILNSKIEGSKVEPKLEKEIFPAIGFGFSMEVEGRTYVICVEEV